MTEHITRTQSGKYVREGSRVIPGESTIHFDEISKKRIFESIDSSKTTKNLLREKYFALKIQTWQNTKCI